MDQFTIIEIDGITTIEKDIRDKHHHSTGTVCMIIHYDIHYNILHEYVGTEHYDDVELANKKINSSSFSSSSSAAYQNSDQVGIDDKDNEVYLPIVKELPQSFPYSRVGLSFFYLRECYMDYILYMI